MRMAPLLLIAVGLIVVFKAGIWNLGHGRPVPARRGGHRRHRADGSSSIPNTLNLVLLFLVAAVVGAAWTIVPALLKARYGSTRSSRR